MLRVGSYNKLKINRFVDFGGYLADEENREVLIPKRYLNPENKVGDIIEVFVYKDSEDRIIASTDHPYLTAGEFGYLKVKDVNRIGAFLDWGLEKDLMLPYGEYDKEVSVGETVFVRVELDNITDRLFASCKIGKFVEKENIELSVGQAVEIQVFKRSHLGYMSIVNGRYMGMLYENEVYSEIEIGEKVNGFVKKVREDGKIDLTIRKKGYGEVEEAMTKILTKIKEGNGFLNLTDDSSPEKIKEALQMSKKTFKKAVGGLYKERIVELTAKGIKLVKSGEAKRR